MTEEKEIKEIEVSEVRRMNENEKPDISVAKVKTKNPRKIKKDLQIIENKEQFSAEAMISKAIDSGASIETMERLLAMRKELKAEYAKEEFYKAMAKFQKECPIVKTNKIVKDKDGTIRYKYATIDHIKKTVAPYISKNGFSHKIVLKNSDKEVSATCIVTHIAGHSEDSSFSAPISEEKFMSVVQKYGARSTFTKRYAFRNAFGIEIEDEDNDGNDGIKDKKPAREDNKNIFMQAKTMIETTDDPETIKAIRNKVKESQEFGKKQKEELLRLIDEK